MYDIKALYEAQSVGEAVSLRLEHPDAHIIAGGSDVLIKMREGKLAGCELLSIYGIDALRGVTMEDDGTIRIGSLTSFSHITKSPIIQEHINVLGEAVDQVGGPQIRNIGTIGGKHLQRRHLRRFRFHAAGWDAIVELTGKDGVRRLPIRDFYIRPVWWTCIPTRFRRPFWIPKEAYAGYQGHYIKYAMRNAMDIATTGCSVNVKLSADKKTLEDVRIAYGVAGPVPCGAPRRKRWPRAKRFPQRLWKPSARRFWRISTPETAGAPRKPSGSISRWNWPSGHCRIH